jgi:uncharacterized damage-inducible protein DinB
MEQFFVDFEERLAKLHSELHRLLDELPEEALDWSPGAEMNSVAVIITHVAGSTRFWLGDMAAGEPSKRVREAEFQVHDLTTAALKARLDEGMAYARGILPQFTLDELGRLCKSPQHEQSFTAGWCLLHALEHTAEHVGHVQLMQQLWAQKGGQK